MTALPRLLLRGALVATAGTVVAVGAASTAGAASGDLTYTCDIQQDVATDPVFTTTFSARFDSAIPDDGGATAPAGSGLSLDPFTGTVVLSEQVVDLIRDNGTTEVWVGGSLQAYFAEDPADTATGIDLQIPRTAVPAQGTMSLAVRNDELGIGTTVRRGPNTLEADSVHLLVFDSASGSAPVVAADCRLVQDGDVAIDRLTGTVAPTATPTTADPTTTASPVRPGLVQTDTPDEQGGGSGLPVLAGTGVLAAAALAWTARPAARRRRH